MTPPDSLEWLHWNVEPRQASPSRREGLPSPDNQRL